MRGHQGSENLPECFYSLGFGWKLSTKIFIIIVCLRLTKSHQLSASPRDVICLSFFTKSVAIGFSIFFIGLYS